MHYYIDGYNLIFSLIESKESLKTLRQKTIYLLQKKFANLRISGTLVFDGSHNKGEESGLSYPSPLVVVYTPKGQSADAYIIEQIELAKNPSQITVITNDKGLILHARTQGASVESNASFIRRLKNRSRKKNLKEIEPLDTRQNIDRLLAIFEDRLKNGDTL